MAQITLQQLEFYHTSTGCTHGPDAINITKNINRNRQEWLQSLLVIRLCLQGQRQYYHQPLSNCKLKRRLRNKRYLRLRNRHFKHNRFLQLPEELVQRISDHLLPTTLANAINDNPPQSQPTAYTLLRRRRRRWPLINRFRHRYFSIWRIRRQYCSNRQCLFIRRSPH